MRTRLIPDIRTKRLVPYSWENGPWIQDYLDDFAADIRIKKGAQLMWTEASLQKTLFTICVDKASALYCLPSDDGAYEFSSSRFDPAIQYSPALRAAFTDVTNVS